ncbi:sensor histidine kinase [Carnobacterium maltaromaticum]|uniref:sensor histidine kinase n=1 Tax=Carnobacterium maltaromaticum TaxID=2751 RepID=UPI0039BE5C6C
MKNKFRTIIFWLLLTFSVCYAVVPLLKWNAEPTSNSPIGSFSQNPDELYGNDQPTTINMIYSDHFYKKLLKDPEKNLVVSNDQMDAYRFFYGDLGTQLADIDQQYQDLLVNAVNERNQTEIERLNNEKNVKQAAIMKNFMDDDALREKIKKEKLIYLQKNKAELMDQYKNELKDVDESFYYYLVDSNGEVYTNLPEKQVPKSIYEAQKVIKSKKTEELQKIDEWAYVTNNIFGNERDLLFRGDGNQVEIKGVAAVKANSPVSNDKKRMEQLNKRRFWKIGFGILAGLIAVVMGISNLKKAVLFPNLLKKYTKVSLDIRILALVIFSFILYMTAIEVYWGTKIFFVVSFIVVACLTTQVRYLVESIRKKELKKQWKNSFSVKIGQFFVAVFCKLSSPSQIIGLIFVYLATGFGIPVALLATLRYGYFSILLYGVLFCLISLPITIGVIKSYLKMKRLSQQPRAILNQLDAEEYPLENQHLPELEADLKKIKTIVLSSAQRQVQSEKLKTELISNVSHDLRTPLTSIISYADLLRQGTNTEAEKEHYIEIINQKAGRMKHLIDDLFEVSKMSTGEVILEKSEVNLGQLLQQSIAEYTEEFAQADLQLRVSKGLEPVLISLDGERIWRVLDNIMGNIVKYALPGTRVYMKLTDGPDFVRLVFKNISKYELNEEATELVERFKRGDDSRNTEGSGLGLAIAHSIIDLHKGKFEIIVDGDMFKLVIDLPKEKLNEEIN